MNQLQVYLIKKKFDYFEIKQDHVVIIIDILRACSTIVTALNSGIDEIIPSTNISEVQNLKFKYNEILTAGERNGEKLPQFDFDNSPVTFADLNLKNKKIALTTTNCTEAIEIAKAAESIYFGSFLNFNNIFNLLSELDSNKRVILMSAGYKTEESEEDNLFAYYLTQKLREIRSLNLMNFDIPSEIESLTQDNMKQIIFKTEHSKRLISSGKINDIEFSLIFDKFDCLPYYANGSIKKK